jgi:hypothetical protein
VGVDEVADEGVQLDYVRADVQEVATGDAAGMLVGGVRGISEETRRRDCKVFPVFRVGEGLDVGRDEDHEYVPKVLRCGGDDALNGFTSPSGGFGLVSQR